MRRSLFGMRARGRAWGLPRGAGAPAWRLCALLLVLAAPPAAARQESEVPEPPEPPSPETQAPPEEPILSPAAPPPVVAPPLPAFAPAPTPERPVASGPLTVEEAVDLALRHSPLVASLRAQQQAAAARTRQSSAMTRPQVSLSGVAAANTSEMSALLESAPGVMPSNILSTPPRTSVGEALMVMVPLYTGGRLSGMVRGARSMEQAAAQRTVASERDVALQVRSGYRRVRLAQALVEVYRELTRATEERTRVSREQYEVGATNLADVLRNQTSHAAAQQQLANAQRDLDLALVDLKTMMGISLSSEIQLTEELAYAPLEGTLEERQAEAGRQRPEVAAADLMVRAAEAEVRAARGSYRPQVYLSAMQNGMLARGTDMVGAGVQLTASIPLMDSGLRRAQVDEAKARLAEAQQERQATLLQVAREVSNAWLAAQAAQVNVATSQAAIAQAEEDYRIAQERYREGRAVNVEVLDALAALVEARTNHLQALYDHSVAKDQLRRATGAP